MDKVVEKIRYFIENNKNILIMGDYDTDGISASAILYKYFEKQNVKVNVFLPNRFVDGYGLTIDTINKVNSMYHPDLIITVDCGITSYGETELAKAQGMDVIITDHHSCTDQIPNAIAVVNPKREDSPYPFKELAGVGVALKMVLALALRFKEDVNQVFYKYSPLAAIGTVADVMPLVDENRIIQRRTV